MPAAHGGRVEVVNNGIITTSGVAAHGINAQSVGGTGGDGGTAGGARFARRQR